VWMICMTISGTSTILAGFQVRIGLIIAAVLAPFYLHGAYTAYRFAKNPTPKNAKVFEILPGVWMILMHFMLGFLPFWV